MLRTFLGLLPQRGLRGAAMLLFLVMFGPFIVVLLVKDVLPVLLPWLIVLAVLYLGFRLVKWRYYQR